MRELAGHPACAYPAMRPPVKVPLALLGEHPCPYLPGRMEQTRAFLAENFPPDLYHEFMDAGFRRSGDLIYQPACRGCRSCLPIRVPVESFRPGKSQRRCLSRNSDLQITSGPPQFSPEKFELYRRYVTARHRQTAEPDPDAFREFLCRSPVQTTEMCYRDRWGRLLAVGTCDVCRQSVSSVYFYFDPDASRRGLGTAGALIEIDLARKLGIPYYYLGYWVAGCRAMEYKASFRPCEILQPDGIWQRLQR
jgi:leucyl-tRNA---protein transferase